MENLTKKYARKETAEVIKRIYEEREKTEKEGLHDVSLSFENNERPIGSRNPETLIKKFYNNLRLKGK